MMKGTYKLGMLLVIGTLAVLLAGCKDQSTEVTAPVEVSSNKTITLTAQASTLEVKDGVKLPVWTYNNQVPGPQIRAKVGDTIHVTLKNELDVPVSIHWHGYPVPNEMDGIPGVTQDAVVPGKSFTYSFKATVPGTYWYHSHQDSVNQVDKGLYGTLIVEDPKEKYDRDYTLVLDEWVNDGKSETDSNDMAGMDHGNMDMSGMSEGGMEGMDHSQMGSDSKGSEDSSMAGMAGMDHDMSMYNIYTVNGKAGASIPALEVKQGERVRVRFVNAGYIEHKMHLQGHDFKVIATDGQPIMNPALIRDQLLAIAPGERYDVEFIADQSGNVLIDEHGVDARSDNMRVAIAYEGNKGKTSPSDASQSFPVFDLTKYGEKRDAAAKLSLNTAFTQELTLRLNTAMKGGKMVYMINDKVFPDTDPIPVKSGDKVKVTLMNESKTDDHPMHLHGHFFQVLSKDGKPIEGSDLVKDTLNLKPGEQYVIAFEADNPGEWMFHCHDLHHASAGMVTEVNYSDYKKAYVPDPSVGNMPE